MGYWHCVNLQNMHTDILEIAGVYDIRQEALDAARKNGLYAYTSMEELLGDQSVEIVVLAIPNNFHKPVGIDCLKAGKHVILEKPACLNTCEFEEMLEVSKHVNRLLTVHQNRRWDSDYSIIKKIVNEKLLGEPYMFESKVQGSRRVLNGWRGYKENGGGMVYDWGVHLLDQLLCLIPSPVTEIYSQLFGIFTKEVDDNFKALLRFENGMSALVEVAMNCFLPQPRWFVCCTEGTAIIEDWNLNGKMVKLVDDSELAWDDVIVYTAAGPTRSMAPRPKETVEELALPQPDSDYSEFYKNIVAAVEGREELRIKPHEVIRTLKVMDAIFESQRLGQSIKCNI